VTATNVPRATIAERLMARIRQAGIEVPEGSSCVRNRVTTWQRNEGAWSWRVDGPDGIPSGVGSWNTMTEMVRAKTWDIVTDEFGDTTIGPLSGPIAPTVWNKSKRRTYTFRAD
jgi:hypothetical protein